MWFSYTFIYTNSCTLMLESFQVRNRKNWKKKVWINILLRFFNSQPIKHQLSESASCFVSFSQIWKASSFIHVIGEFCSGDSCSQVQQQILLRNLIPKMFKRTKEDFDWLRKKAWQVEHQTKKHFFNVYLITVAFSSSVALLILIGEVKIMVIIYSTDSNKANLNQEWVYLTDKRF